MSGNSLINLGELSKPATLLVEKIAEAIGGYFKPYQIRRIAIADADAELIRAQSEIEISELQRRALQRFIAEEAKKQENIEAITEKALPEVSETAEPDRVDADWIMNFFDKARLISDNEMQALWAKVLAGEANHPGTYSKRTVNYLASLDSEDARHFSALCRFCWTIEGEQVPLIQTVESLVYQDFGITHSVLKHLDDVGLIRYGYPMAVSRGGDKKRFRVSYFGEIIELELSRFARSGGLNAGTVFLTKIGMELASLCGSTPVPGFLEHALAEWMKEGDLVPSSPYPRPTAELVESVLR